jgi:hypothetical protein
LFLLLLLCTSEQMDVNLNLGQKISPSSSLIRKVALGQLKSSVISNVFIPSSDCFCPPQLSVLKSLILYQLLLRK